jgi:AcrR family transcriptional regulator
MNLHGVRQRTRRAILEALADVIIETEGIGFSVQTVADRAGVTHRTIYNHFPTRDALCEAFAEYVDELLGAPGLRPEFGLTLDSLPAMVITLYEILDERERYVRASVMLMIANRQPMASWRKRTKLFEALVARHASNRTALTPRQITAAVRMFASSMGWHLLTEQCGLTTGEAAAASEWATRTLLDAATGTPQRPSSAPAAKKRPRKTKATKK